MMKNQKVMVWTGGNPRASEGCQALAEALPVLSAPAPLRRAALIEYYWGLQQFQIVAAACSVRTTQWGDQPMTWLHCKARQTMATKLDESNELIAVLFPAHYVTAIEPGPTFRLLRSRPCEDLGVFPPNQLPPENALPLTRVEQVIAELLAPERN